LDLAQQQQRAKQGLQQGMQQLLQGMYGLE
jgi:hypothetical protein